MRRERDALAKRVAELEGLLTNAHLRNATDQDEHSAQRAALSKRVAELEGATDRELCLGCGHPVSDCVESWSAPDAGGCSGRFAGRGVIIRLRAALRKALKGGT